jgi:outer membrane biogenesis lipoprotein LolB
MKSCIRSILLLTALAQLTACNTPASKPTSQVDLFSQKVQAAMQRGEFDSKSIDITLPNGRKRTITAQGWTDS